MAAILVVMRSLFFLLSRAGALVYLMRHPQVPIVLKALPMLALAYIIWPRDLLFDFPPVIGHLDDFLVTFALTSLFLRLASRYVLGEPRKRDYPETVQADFRVVDEGEERR